MNAGKEECFNLPLEIIKKTMNFDVAVLYKVSNVIENRLILEVVKVLDSKDSRLDLKEGRRLRLFMDNPDKRFVNEVTAFLKKRTSYINVPGMGCDLIGYVYLPENFGGAYLFGGDFFGKESSIKSHEVSSVEIMCNFLSSILLKTQFKHQAENDDLTGLYSSRKIKQAVDRMIKRFERKPDSFASIAMGDIDHFKKINDTYGHIQGDIILKEVGQILSDSMRGYFDLAGRYGGEEFLLIFDETRQENALAIVERVRKNIEQHKFQQVDKSGKVLENKFLSITMSFGIAQLSKASEIDEVKDWVSMADNALYFSKNSGRNKTTVYIPDKKQPDTIT
ncbi:MAG: GGDEF domain-containing protein [Desulfobacteraceae bacterium]|nr:GGDEF domain-containing protein [Desulfobacteraceae bacterium]